MKKLLCCLMGLLLLLAGCSLGEEPLRTGTQAGMTASVVPLEKPESKPTVKSVKHKPFEKNFHGTQKLVCVTNLHDPDSDLTPDSPCRICPCDTLELCQVIRFDWLGDRLVPCPAGETDGMDMVMQRRVWESYGCAECDFGFTRESVYEVINCYADSAIKLGEQP